MSLLTEPSLCPSPLPISSILQSLSPHDTNSLLYLTSHNCGSTQPVPPILPRKLGLQPSRLLPTSRGLNHGPHPTQLPMALNKRWPFSHARDPSKMPQWSHHPSTLQWLPFTSVTNMQGEIASSCPSSHPACPLYYSWAKHSQCPF